MAAKPHATSTMRNIVLNRPDARHVTMNLIRWELHMDASIASRLLCAHLMRTPIKLSKVLEAYEVFKDNTRAVESA